MKAYERLLSYVKVFTPSNEETGTSPSTQYQFDLARLLVQELKELGVKDADVDEHCNVHLHRHLSHPVPLIPEPEVWQGQTDTVWMEKYRFLHCLE